MQFIDKGSATALLARAARSRDRLVVDNALAYSKGKSLKLILEPTGLALPLHLIWL
jgi:hypothetical protein